MTRGIQKDNDLISVKQARDAIIDATAPLKRQDRALIEALEILTEAMQNLQTELRNNEQANRHAMLAMGLANKALFDSLHARTVRGRWEAVVRWWKNQCVLFIARWEEMLEAFGDVDTYALDSAPEDELVAGCDNHGSHCTPDTCDISAEELLQATSIEGLRKAGVVVLNAPPEPGTLADYPEGTPVVVLPRSRQATR